MTDTTTAVAETAATIGSKATMGGSFTSITAFFVGINWLGWVGVITAVLGLLINAYFSYQRDKREKELHKLKMEQVKNETNW